MTLERRADDHARALSDIVGTLINWIFAPAGDGGVGVELYRHPEGGLGRLRELV